MSLAYDPLGRLQTTATGSTTVQYLYDGDDLVAEYGGSTILRRFIHGPGADNLAIWFEGSALTAANASYLIADRQGSIVAATTPAGNTTSTLTYDAYGAPSAWSVPTFGYTGQLALPVANLWFYKARVYDPVAGRFLQTDPVGYKDDVNLYAYVGNDPIDHADPTGQTVDCSSSSCTIEAHSLLELGVDLAYVGGVYVQRVVQNAMAPPAPVRSDPAKPTAPPVPGQPVGENPQPGRTGGRTVSGPLAPQHGGTGDAGQDFDHLTGGTGKPNSDQGRPPGTQVGDNGVQIRPGPKGPRIDIPGSGAKPPETLHYPPPPPPPPKLPNE
jgi:RHS repeat-associated protein